VLAVCESAYICIRNTVPIVLMQPIACRITLQAHDGTAVLIDTLQTARTITIKTTEVLPHTTLSPNETKGASTEGIQEGQSSERGATPTIRWVSKMQVRIGHSVL
jgi:hypothetical protein